MYGIQIRRFEKGSRELIRGTLKRKNNCFEFQPEEVEVGIADQNVPLEIAVPCPAKIIPLKWAGIQKDL